MIIEGNDCVTYKIGVVGQYADGPEAGRFVLVQDDRAQSSGYLILTADDPEMSTRPFDDWVADEDSLDAYFDDADGRIVWSGP